MGKYLPAQSRVVVRPQLFVVLLVFVALFFGLRGKAFQPIGVAVPAKPGAAVHSAQTLQPPLIKPAIEVVDCSLQACLALTFDDGPNTAVTPRVLEVLERHHARATFFVIGSHVPGNEELLRRMYRGGNEIGNHSWGHPDFTTLSPEQIQQQLSKTQEIVVNAGVPAPTLFRPPYGAINAVVKSRTPLTIALWNIDPEDWRTKDPKEIVRKVEANVHPGRVVDLHDTHPVTADALEQLVTDLQKDYQLVTFSELLDLAPGQPGVFYGR